MISPTCILFLIFIFGNEWLVCVVMSGCRTERIEQVCWTLKTFTLLTLDWPWQTTGLDLPKLKTAVVECHRILLDFSFTFVIGQQLVATTDEHVGCTIKYGIIIIRSGDCYNRWQRISVCSMHLYWQRTGSEKWRQWVSARTVGVPHMSRWHYSSHACTQPPICLQWEHAPPSLLRSHMTYIHFITIDLLIWFTKLFINMQQ